MTGVGLIRDGKHARGTELGFAEITREVHDLAVGQAASCASSGGRRMRAAVLRL